MQRCVSNTACSRSHSWKARLCVLVTPGRGDSGSAGQEAVPAHPHCAVSPSPGLSPLVLTVLAVELQDQAAGTGLEQDEAFPHRLLQRGQRAENAQEGLWGWIRGLSPAQGPQNKELWGGPDGALHLHVDFASEELRIGPGAARLVQLEEEGCEEEGGEGRTGGVDSTEGQLGT